jgi:hypothetical protein
VSTPGPRRGLRGQVILISGSGETSANPRGALTGPLRERVNLKSHAQGGN